MNLFRLKREEWLPAVVFLLLMAFLHYLIVAKFWVLFADYYHLDSWRVFMRNFHMSGFDPITYSVLTDWQTGYNVVRHPLLPFFMYPLYLLNQVLWALTGCNCAQIIMAVVLLSCAFYSYVFLYRTLREVTGASRPLAALLSYFFFGCAYILVALIVPDHFALSLVLLLLTVYVSGRKIKAGRKYTLWQMLTLFVLTAGVTLSNGILTWICVWAVNGRAFFRLRVIGTAVAVSLLLLVSGFMVNKMWGYEKDGEVTQWIDTSTPRMASVVENFFGESIQLHREHLLGDVLMRRPVVVTYTWKAQYAVEAFIVVLFAAGLWCGRRERFCQMLMGCLAYNVVLHLLLGFALNEVYIMACHWLFVVPLSMAYVFSAVRRPFSRGFFATLVLGVTLYLWIYHGYWLWRYLTWPLAF